MAIKINNTVVIDNGRNITDVENVGDANTVYYGDGSNLTGIGGGGAGIELVTANVSMSSGSAYLVNSTSAVTLTLPGSPSSGDAVDILNNVDYAHTVARNGSTIEGSAQDMGFDQVGVKVKMWYDGSTWRLF